MKRFLLVSVVLVVGLMALGVTNIRISGWPGNPVEEAVIMKNVEEFNNMQTDIVVEWQPIPGDFRQMLVTQYSAGTAPDIFYVEAFWFEELAKQNVLLPLDLYIKRDVNFDIDWFYPNLIEAFKYEDRIYGIPKDFSTLALVFNKKIFDQYGVAYPTDEDTWFDMLDKALQLKRKGFETPLVLAADLNRVLPFVYGTGGDIVDENLNVALGKPDAKFGLNFYLDLVNKYGVAQEPANLGAGWIGEAYGKESVAMAMTGPWTIGFLAGDYPEVLKNTGIVEMPHLIEKSTMVYTVSWSINRTTPNKDAAWEVLKFLVTKGQERFVAEAGVLASNIQNAEKDTDPTKQAFYRGAEYGIPWMVKTPSGIFSRAHDQLNSLLKDLFYQKVSLSEALALIEENYPVWVAE